MIQEKVIRAKFDDQTITVYQAYNKDIASSAVQNQRFVSPPFKIDRMTWIKPSFLWMMYRSGWASKENQEHVLAIRITREGFEYALQHSCLSHFDSEKHASHESWRKLLGESPVRVQWDPEKDIFMRPLDYRAIQIGLSGNMVEKYVNEWTVEITDITEACKSIHQLINENKVDQAKEAVPLETIYPLPEHISKLIS